MIDVQSLVLRLQVGEVGLQIRRTASGRAIRGAQDELPASIRSRQHPQGLQPAVRSRLSDDPDGGGADTVLNSQRHSAVAAPVWSVDMDEAVAGQNQEAIPP